MEFVPIYTERLMIRKTIIDDVDLLIKMDKQNTTQLYLGGIKNKSKEERIIFLENKIEKSKNDKLGVLTVCLLDEIPIGFIELNINDSRCEFSYIFDFEHCKKGYCSEACYKLIDICFNKLKVKKICAKTIKDNEPSKRVLSKLGFKLKDQYNMFLEYELEKR